MTPSIRRRNHKWAMCAKKGGKCVCGCGERVTHGNMEKFHFHHKTQVNNPNDKTDRWSGAIRDWPPFTDEWNAWADAVELIYEPCHEKIHNSDKQLSIDWDFQARMDDYDKKELLMANGTGLAMDNV